MTWMLSIPWARNDGCLDCDFFVDLGALTCVSYLWFVLSCLSKGDAPGRIPDTARLLCCCWSWVSRVVRVFLRG